MSKSAVIYVTYDGAINSTCGVGVLSQYFINSYSHVIDSLSTVGSKFDFHVIAVNLLPTAHGYSNDIHKKTLQVTADNGGALHLIDNGTEQTENYGNYNNWGIASKNCASVLDKLKKDYDHLYVYLVDTPFLNVPRFIPNSSANITFLLVPHSDVYSHFPDDISAERLMWETEAFDRIKLNKNVFMASTSKYLAHLISKKYQLESDKIINLQTGLLLSDPRFNRISVHTVEKYLASNHIPLNKNLIFSVARAVPYKGFEELIDAFHNLCQKRTDVHLVFIASPFRNSSSNVDVIKDKISKYNLGEYCTAIYDLDMDLPRYICQWENTKIVAQLSNCEPFGLVPEEVRMWATSKGPIIVASRLNGFLEQITSKKDGYLVDPFNVNEVSRTFDKILSLPDEKISYIVDEGRKRCIKNYDYVKTISQSILSMVKQS